MPIYWNIELRFLISSHIQVKNRLMPMTLFEAHRAEERIKRLLNYSRLIEGERDRYDGLVTLRPLYDFDLR